MSQALTDFVYKKVEILSLDGNNRIDLTNSILFCDYFEDILSPCITMTMQIISNYSIFNGMPIRGGEKVVMDIRTPSGEFILDGDYGMYVYKVSGLVTDGTKEMFTLHLVSREVLTNETVRIQKKYEKKPISEHVTSILKDQLLTKKFKSENIEKTANSYSFIGTLKKPLHVLTWLGPKSIPSSTGNSGNSGNKGKGVAGYLFYETKDGFNFRSIDTLVSPTNSQSGSTSKENIPKYIYTQVVEQGSPQNILTILNYNFEKNIDLMKSLRVGIYSNVTYFYDLYTNTVQGIEYYINEEVKHTLGGNSKLAYPEEFGSKPSRILVRTSDKGILDPNNDKIDAGRDNTDMAKSFARYNLLFTQALNMSVPLNVTLRAGKIIYAQFQKVEASKNGQVDPEQSGNYLIKELRHHFESGQLVTSLRLVRDNYGLYGANQ
jgi:hypothetical protein